MTGASGRLAREGVQEGPWRGGDTGSGPGTAQRSGEQAERLKGCQALSLRRWELWFPFTFITLNPSTVKSQRSQKEGRPLPGLPWHASPQRPLEF